MYYQDILANDKKAKVIAAGDFNEFVAVEPLKQFMKISGMEDLDEVARVKDVERYTYLFDMQNQALDHMFVSKGAQKKAKFEHIHVNTWSTFAEQVSDHDPSVAKLNVCA